MVHLCNILLMIYIKILMFESKQQNGVSVLNNVNKLCHYVINIPPFYILSQHFSRTFKLNNECIVRNSICRNVRQKHEYRAPDYCRPNKQKKKVFQAIVC